MVDESDMVMSLEAQKTRVASSNECVNLTKTAHKGSGDRHYLKFKWDIIVLQRQEKDEVK